jgi:hypothetical protein
MIWCIFYLGFMWPRLLGVYMYIYIFRTMVYVFRRTIRSKLKDCFGRRNFGFG